MQNKIIASYTYLTKWLAWPRCSVFLSQVNNALYITYVDPFYIYLDFLGGGGSLPALNTYVIL